MPERLSFQPEEKDFKIFPYDIKHEEAFILAEQISKDEKVAERLDFLKKHHLPSFEHCMRVGTLSADLGLENKLDETELRKVATGGILHDLGKCVIPLEILNKTSPLTNEELKTIRTHARLGFEQLQDPIFDGIREIVVAHHEFTKENAYPRTRSERAEAVKPATASGRNEKDDGGAALVAVADIFDALAEHRPYNPKFSFEDIKTIIEKNYAGPTKYIEQILERFKKD
jgi:HD-GYP domain-containing protein (c-di-GMP phosphodiesterase class II)